MMWTAVLICFVAVLFDAELTEARICYLSRAYGSSSYYRCSRDEYCCGTRDCCLSSTTSSFSGIYSLWYLWFCLILFILICTCASGAYYRKRQRISRARTAPAGVTMTTVQQAPQTLVVSATAASGFYANPAAPPSYNQVVHTGHAVGGAYPVGFAPPPQYSGNQVTVQHCR